MSKQPAIQFYVGDWRKDPTVTCLSYAARGLWFEMLLLMFESPSRGYLLLESGLPMNPQQIARATGGELKDVQALLFEMEQAGTFSRNLPDKDGYRPELADGVILNRRMVRDEKRRKVHEENGKLGKPSGQCATVCPG